MTKEEFCKNYWSYYLVLEGRFLKLQNYIAFDKENYKCYSTELIAQFQTICSEVDVVSKILCGFDAADEKTMDDYRAQYTLRCPGIEAQEVTIDYFDVKVQPFKALATEHSFPWWTDYNKVKHSRVTSYQRGNLKNVMFALAGLYVLEKEIYKIITSEEKMISESEIMHMVGWHESVNILF